jgi:biotin carboxyl carrier protein
VKLIITVEGKKYEVEVEVAETEPPVAVRYVATGAAAAPRPAAPAAAGDSGRQPADESKACRSPLAGVVSEINVEVGQEVEVEQPVLVLEAMKMFTTITSPVAGKVKSIDVAVGAAVKQGQLLIEFE